MPFSRRVIPDCIYKSEAVRIASFRAEGFTWPIKFIKVEDLAREGFYCIRDRDMVQCVFCHLVIGEFVFGDVVRTEHEKYSPSCRFIRGEQVGNQPKVRKAKSIVEAVRDESSEITNYKKQIQLLETRVSQLSQLVKCKICLSEDMDTVLFPCCHMLSCVGCAKHFNQCPVCRLEICGRVRVFT